jgi:hypothetical protein
MCGFGVILNNAFVHAPLLVGYALVNVDPRLVNVGARSDTQNFGSLLQLQDLPDVKIQSLRCS